MKELNEFLFGILILFIEGAKKEPYKRIKNAFEEWLAYIRNESPEKLLAIVGEGTGKAVGLPNFGRHAPQFFRAGVGIFVLGALLFLFIEKMYFHRTLVCSSKYDPIFYLAVCGFVFWNAAFEQMFRAIRTNWIFSFVVILSSIIFFAFLHMYYIDTTVAQGYHVYLNQLLRGALSYKTFVVIVAVAGTVAALILTKLVFVWVAYFLILLLVVNFLKITVLVRDELATPFCLLVLFLIRYCLKVVFPSLEI